MEADLSPRILVLGHSFVWRIARFVAVTSLPCVASTFHLPGEPVVQFHGIGGRTLPKLLHFDLLAVATFKPNIVTLEIGSNNLCSPNIDVSSLANDIFAFLQLLHIRFSVKHIIVSQILPRKKSPPMRPAYNHHVSHLKRQLLHLLRHAPFATLWFHYPLIYTRQPIFLPDGVHLNSHGNHLLYHSYQRAILRYVGRLTRNCNSSNQHVSVSYRPPCCLHHKPPSRLPRSNPARCWPSVTSKANFDPTGKQVTFYPSSLMISHDVQPLISPFLRGHF